MRAQIITLLTNLAVAVAALRVQHVSCIVAKRWPRRWLAADAPCDYSMRLCFTPSFSAFAPSPLPRPQLLHVKGFISFAFGPDLLSRFLSFVCWLVMTAK